MVIETTVISSLRLGVLSCISQGTSASGDLPLEEFQLTAAPLHPIPAAIPFDSSTLGKRKAYLAETEGFGERNYLAFSLIHPDAHGLKATHDLSG